MLSKVDEDWSSGSDDNNNENSSKPGTSASLWIENLVDKFDSEETKFYNHKNVSAESVINNIPDSTKKSKFKKFVYTFMFRTYKQYFSQVVKFA